MSTTAEEVAPSKGLSKQQLIKVGLLIAGTLAILGGVAAAGITGAIVSAAEGNSLGAILLIIGTALLSLMLLFLVLYFVAGSIFFHKTLKGTTFLSRKMEESR